MKTLTTILAALAAVGAAYGPVRAADLPLEPPAAYYKAPVAGVYNWTGIYIGVNGGYGLASKLPAAFTAIAFQPLITMAMGGWAV